MTMLITKFNKLIANKFIWIGFTVLIVLAFVVMDMAGPEDRQDPAMLEAGTLFGETISNDQLRVAYRHAYMGIVLSVSQMFPIDREMDRELTRMAWLRLASLMKAQELGMRANDQEVMSAIENFRDFQQDGQFSMQIYESFVQQYLPALGFTAGQFEEHVRQELVLQKLQRMVTEGVLVAPAEVERFIRSNSDEFTIHYAVINANVLGSGTEVTEAEARAFFDADPEAFMLPPMMRVQYVRFPIAERKALIEISEEEALDFYDRNLQDYMVEEDVQEEVEGEEDENTFPVMTARPFEEVQEEIVAQLQEQQAARRTMEDARAFVIGLEPARDGTATSFAERAAEYELTIEETEFFAEADVPAEIDAGTAFGRAAFRLEDHPRYYFSDAIVGEEYVYVMALLEAADARVPAFEEVADEVTLAAQARATRQQVVDLAETFKEMVEQGLGEGRTFAGIAEEMAIPVTGPLSFTAAEGLPDLPFGRQLMLAVQNHNEDEVTEPIDIEDGQAVVYVASRTPADPAQYDDFRPQIVESLSRERAQVLFNEWQENLLKEANFQPREVQRTPRDEEDGEQDADR
jgi:parvulin-like peptidyl-prolyl isomerase